ncbi:DNA damage-inducible protein 1 [Neophaeococcomyces mojaviensis]|uniref:DNA damage-inducible protein 1 n=1 Tax=Neophaeococcomyces mojaviensis TaxID=3383035 RepID=A0ACC3A168_9EURO|nr:DNA damage-inducible protein 1 [Knufia sp. JES_112]
MRISVTVVATDVSITQDLIPLEVLPDMPLDAVKGFIEDEIQIPPAAQHFLYNNQPVVNTTQTLASLGMSDGDVLSLIIRTQPSQPQRRQQPAGQSNTSQRGGQASSELPDAETIRLQLLGDARLLANIQARDPELAHAASDSDRFRRIYTQRQQQSEDQQREKEQMMALLDSDPFNEEAQAKIEEIIRQERVMENMQKALEDNPESFGRVIMLYIDVIVNNVPIKAFVDSGAQTTIMSPDAADRCGIMRLIDRRFGGIARGVGTATILGRVHSADIQIGQYNLASSFTVMEGKGVDLLLGLDMLKRHQMCIDLKDNCLRIQDDKIPFLAENEIPKAWEEAMDHEPTVEGPGGTEIGATTGTVKPKDESSTAPSASASNTSGIRIHPQGSAGNILTSNRTAQQQAVRAPAQPTAVSEQSIAQITELGFSRQEAIAALQQANGNVELAISLLL